MRGVLGSWGGAFADVFGPLRGFVLLCLAASATLLAALAALAIFVLIPMIPDGAGWRGIAFDVAKALAGGASIVLAIALMPVVAMVVGGALFDVVAARVEQARFPNDPPATPPGLATGLAAGLRIAGPALALNLLATPLLFIPGVNIVAFTALNALLMGREYFSLAALRFGDWTRARDLRRRHGGAIFIAALAPALLLLVPIASFLTPLFGAAIMVRLHKSLTR
jgi:CysZ protein